MSATLPVLNPTADTTGPPKPGILDVPPEELREKVVLPAEEADAVVPGDGPGHLVARDALVDLHDHHHAYHAV